MRLRTLLVMLLVIGGLGILWHASAVVRFESVSSVFSAASAVVTGEVVSVEPHAEVTEQWHGRLTAVKNFDAYIEVDRVYKGPINESGLRISYSRPMGDACVVTKCVELTAGEFGLFLLANEHHKYRLIDETHGKIPISRLKFSHTGEGMRVLHEDLVAGLQDDSEDRVLQNLELLGAMPAGSSPALPHTLLSSNASPVVKLAVHKALLRLRDYGEFSSVGQLIELSGTAPRQIASRDEVCALIAELHEPTLSKTLIQFSHSPSDELRESAIHALRGMEVPDAVPVFVKALDDPVTLIRYDAVMGLASVGQNWQLAPSVDTFLKDESKYIGAWKQWWADAGRLRYK